MREDEGDKGAVRSGVEEEGMMMMMEGRTLTD